MGNAVRTRGVRAAPVLLPAFLSVLCAGACHALPAEARGPGALQVDLRRGEVRFPAWFANPSRKLEVFACHESGPTHETVVAFQAEGEEIDRALREVGFRGPEFWNVTSPWDLRLTGGDRAVVFLSWEWKGKVFELPAEDLLVEEGTALPLFLRGFSFASQKVPRGDPPRPGIPRAVELTIGGATRQSAAFSLLDHPNDLPEMVSWTPAPEVSPRAVPDLELLVESRAPCTLLIRRVRNEVDLLELALSRESDPARREVRRRQRPLAEAIDGKKAAFEGLVREVRSLLEEGEGRKTLAEEERRRFAAETVKLMTRGALLAAEIRELYLSLWGLEEEHRLAQAGLAALQPEQKAWVVMSHRSGFQFELCIARKRREAAALAAGGPGVPSDHDGLRRKALETEITALEVERERRWAGFKLETEIRPKLKALDPRSDGYTLELFRESELRALADMRALRARGEALRAEAWELRARSDGSLERVRDEIGRRRALSEARARLAAAEGEHVDLLEKIRWARNPPGGAREGSPAGEAAAELRRLEQDKVELAGRIRKLRAALEAASGRPAGTGEEPPDPDGLPLYPGEGP